MTLLLILFTATVAWSAWNLYNPIYQHPKMAAVSFLSGLGTGELALHVIFWEIWIFAFFVLFGSVWGFVGAVCFVIVAFSWASIALFYFSGYQARDEIDDALAAGLGDNYQNDIDDDVYDFEQEALDANAIRHPFRSKDPSVDLIKNVPFGNQGQSLDIRRPTGSVSDAPVLLQIHGGAWTEKMGSKNEQGLPLMNYMAKQGWVCVATSYRLSPTHTFPDHIVDIKQCIVWIKEHIAEYGGRPDFIMVTGGSAGGHLTMLATLSPNDPAFQPGFEDKDTTVQGAAPFYGPIDFTDQNQLANNDGLLEALETSVIKRSLAGNEDYYRSLSPLHRIHADAPPFLIIHGDKDTLVPIEEGRLFAEHLEEVSNAPVAYAEISNGQHAFDLVPSIRSEYTKFGVARFLSWCYSQHLKSN